MRSLDCSLPYAFNAIEQSVRVALCVCVDQSKMRFRIQKRLMRVLSVQIHKKIAELFQFCGIYHRSVDAANVSTRDGQFAIEHEFLAVIKLTLLKKRARRRLF